MINSTGSARDLLAKLPRVNYMRPVSIDLQKLLRIGFVEEPNPDVPTVDLAGHEPNGCATFCYEAAPNGCGDPQQQQYCKNLRDSDVFVLGEGERNHAYEDAPQANHEPNPPRFGRIPASIANRYFRGRGHRN